MYLDQTLLPTVLPTNLPLRAGGVCTEEDEMENETSSQPSMSTYDPSFSSTVSESIVHQEISWNISLQLA